MGTAEKCTREDESVKHPRNVRRGKEGCLKLCGNLIVVFVTLRWTYLALEYLMGINFPLLESSCRTDSELLCLWEVKVGIHSQVKTYL